MGPTWVLSAPDGPHVGPVNIAITIVMPSWCWSQNIPDKLDQYSGPASAGHQQPWYWMDSFYIWHKWSLSLEGVSRVRLFSESGDLKFWQILETFRPWPSKKKSTILDGFFPYLAQMITTMRGCVAYNDLWPWPISWKSCPLCSIYSSWWILSIFGTNEH